MKKTKSRPYTTVLPMDLYICGKSDPVIAGRTVAEAIHEFNKVNKHHMTDYSMGIITFDPDPDKRVMSKEELDVYSVPMTQEEAIVKGFSQNDWDNAPPNDFRRRKLALMQYWSIVAGFNDMTFVLKLFLVSI